jgi:two-component system cell cycle response regulator
MRVQLRPHTSILYLASLMGGLGVLALHSTLGFGGPHSEDLFQDWIYNVLMLGSALAVLARGALVREERAAWLTMGAGLLCWCAGELYYSLVIQGTSAEAGGRVSPADALYLAMYPCFYIALGLLARRRLRNLRIGMWLDGLIAALGAASIAAALILPPIFASATGTHSSIVVSLAYPIGDLLLMMFAVGALGITGWRTGNIWLPIAASMLACAIADSTYLYLTATNSYQAGTWIECLWPLAAILLAIAAWMPATRLQPRQMKSWQMVLVPTLALLSALGILVYGNVDAQLNLPALVLATATVLAVGVHLILTLRQNLMLLAHSRRLSLTDPLTGLGNRRLLMGDLRLACRTALTSEPWELVLYDLDGFKLYNDTFGHPAGDTLLVRLSERLKRAVEPHGTAYRMGGDEFCVLFDCSHAESQNFAQSSVEALCEHSPSFSITASHGVVRIPTEAADHDSIMQLADQRLYRRKEEVAARRASAYLNVSPVDTLLSSAGSLDTEAQHPDETRDRSFSTDGPGANGRPPSGDAHDGEQALPLGKHDRGPLAGTTPEQGARDRRVRRKPPL